MDAQTYCVISQSTSCHWPKSSFAHGTLGGSMTMLSGGKFEQGFLSGALGSVVATGSSSMFSGTGKLGQAMGTVIGGSLAGGLGATIAGGNFWDGVRNGAISAGLNHCGTILQQVLTRPILFVQFMELPKGMSKTDFMNQLRQRLVDNGVTSKIEVTQYNFWGKILEWLNGSPIAQIDIRNYASGEGLDARIGGFADPFSNLGTVYNGLTGFGPKPWRPLWQYVNVALHELGHAIWGFRDVGFQGNVNNIMDYSSGNNPYAFFIQVHYELIRNSAWGGN